MVFLANAVPEFRDALNTEYKGGLKNWRFDGVMRVLRRPPNPVFDAAPRSPSGNIAERALALNELRQRIHSGRLLHEPTRYPHPDARPEEASEAREVATRLARIVLDWVAKNPLPPK